MNSPIKTLNHHKIIHFPNQFPVHGRRFRLEVKLIPNKKRNEWMQEGVKWVDEEEWESWKKGLPASDSVGEERWGRDREGGGRTQQGRRKHVQHAQCTPRRKWSRKGSQKNFIRLHYFRLQFISDFPDGRKCPWGLVGALHTSGDRWRGRRGGLRGSGQRDGNISGLLAPSIKVILALKRLSIFSF